MDWTDQFAPSLNDFRGLVQNVWDRLPDTFKANCEDIVICIEDLADDETCGELGCDSPFELLGLYQGVDLTRKSVADQADTPDMVSLYRRPILDVWSDGEDTLGLIVAHVLIHEIGHHFGLSDADMEAIEAQMAD